MTPKQRELARHALGFPNKRNVSYRNHFCAGAGSDDYAEWEAMVAAGLAIKRTAPHCGPNDALFHMTFKGALEARDTKEHLSPEDCAAMREVEAK